MTRRDDGFSLIEVLVALALLGTASVLMAEGFSANRGAAQRMQDRRGEVEAIADAQSRLRTQLESMTIHARFERARPYVDLDGSSRRLEFVSGADTQGSVRRLALDLSPSGELRLTPVEDDASFHASPLLKGVATVELAYWGRGDGDPAASWRSEWQAEPTPPQLIRIRVGFAPGDRRVWPELIIRPAAEVDADCVVDADTGACRGRT